LGHFENVQIRADFDGEIGVSPEDQQRLVVPTALAGAEISVAERSAPVLTRGPNPNLLRKKEAPVCPKEGPLT
jgi:hypothetical protein